MRILQRISLWLQKQKERIARFFSFLRKKERTLPPKTKPAAQVPLDMLQEMGDFLRSRYHFRFNLLTETTEFRKIQEETESFRPVTPRDLNSFCQAAQQARIACWDRDISRFVHSDQVSDYHPIRHYMSALPAWDGVDRVTPLARRVSDNDLWVKGFHRWMRAMAAGWMGLDKWHANSVAPVLVSRTQGMHKSTFCKMLLPDCLQAYYTDSVDLSAPGQMEQKLALFGLINLDEFDQITPRKMALLKNLMQMAELRVRKAYQKNFRPLPRIASFIATSNRKDLLSDPTGSRRFLCVELTHKIDASPIDHDQLYAQLKAELEAGERYWFTTEEELEIQRNNAAFYKQTAEEELFHTLFRPARKAEPCERLTSAEIFRRVKEKHPAAMLGMKLRNFTLMLANLGVPRLHLRYGNVYEVVPIEKIDDSQELADR